MEADFLKLIFKMLIVLLVSFVGAFISHKLSIKYTNWSFTISFMSGGLILALIHFLLQGLEINTNRGEIIE